MARDGSGADTALEPIISFWKSHPFSWFQEVVEEQQRELGKEADSLRESWGDRFGTVEDRVESWYGPKCSSEKPHHCKMVTWWKGVCCSYS